MMPAQNFISGPDKEWNEYKLVIEPPSALLKKISLYTGKLFNTSRPGETEITIASFFAREEMEATLFRWLQRICNLQQVFSLSIKNFECRPPHSVYLQLEDVSPITSIGNQVKMIEPYLKGSDCPPVEINQAPLLMVFKFPENVFHEAREVFSGLPFEDRFTIDFLRMYKRKGDQNSFDLLSYFSLPEVARY